MPITKAIVLWRCVRSHNEYTRLLWPCRHTGYFSEAAALYADVHLGGNSDE